MSPPRQPESTLLIGLPDAFRQLPEAQRAELCAYGKQHAVPRNEVVMPFGTARPPVLAVRSGLLTIEYPTRRERTVITAFLHAHDLFFSSLDGKDVSAYDLRSVAPSVVIVWPSAVFRHVVASSAPFGRWLAEQTNQKLQSQYLRQAQLSAPLDQQLAFLYWSLAESELPDGGRLLNTKVPQADLASYLGVTREEVSRKKQILERVGYLRDTETGLVLSAELPRLFSPQSGVTNPWRDTGLSAESDMAPL